MFSFPPLPRFGGAAVVLCYKSAFAPLRPPHPRRETRMDEVLSVAQVVPCTEAEGPGRRYALWFQGCPLRCPGCCNPEMLPFAGGTPRAAADILADIDQTRRHHAIEGLTLLGGEPLA